MFRAALWKRKAWLQDSPRDLNNNKSNPEWCDTFCRVETRMCPDVENWWFKMFRWLHRKDLNLKKKSCILWAKTFNSLPEWSRRCALLCFLSLHDCEACCKRNRDASKTILKSPICSSRGVTWPDSVIGQFSKAVVQFELTSWLRSFYLYQHLYSGAPVVSHSSYHRPSPCAPRCRTSACSSQWFPYWPCGDARCGSGTSPTSSPSHPAGPSGSLKQTDGERKKASGDSLFRFITELFVKCFVQCTIKYKTMVLFFVCHIPGTHNEYYSIQYLLQNNTSFVNS